MRPLVSERNLESLPNISGDHHHQEVKSFYGLNTKKTGLRDSMNDGFGLDKPRPSYDRATLKATLSKLAPVHDKKFNQGINSNLIFTSSDIFKKTLC